MEITIQDLEIVVRLIDVVSERGAIKGDEMAIIGSLRNKFASVLASVEQEPSVDEAPVDEITEEELV